MAWTPARKSRAFGWAVAVSALLHAVLVYLLARLPTAAEPRPPVAVDLAVLSIGEPRANPAPVLVDDPDGSEESSETLVAVQALAPPPSPAPPAPGVSLPSRSTPGNSGRGSADGVAGGKGLFGVARSARSVVYVLDRSMSMGPHGALDVAREELLASLRRLPAGVCFQVVAYNTQAEPLELHGYRDLAAADAAAFDQVRRAVTRLEPSGGTDHRRALLCGLKFRPEVLYFVTDADDLTPADVLAVSDYNRGRTCIHAIELRPGRTPLPDSPLRRLAESNRGTYRRVSPE